MQRIDYVVGELTVGERSVELYFAPFSDEESGGVLIVLHDVTEHRKTEERRKEFVANVSHELRTPLTNVRSYAETIREAGDDLSRETENDFLEVVISGADRMTHIVRAAPASPQQARATPAAQASAFPSRRRSSSVTTARSRSLTAPAPARPSA